ncbi:MAG: hypothetical protein IKN73_02515 [Alphaproteobacteria bacterium]|nr:hypothetical protein [Alphaproteobacteria bacterium]
MNTARTRKIRRFIKISVALVIVFLLIISAFFVQHSRTFENNSLSKWSQITDTQRISTLERIVKESENQDLIISCVTKIAQLPDSNEMIIRDAISLCYNGIKLNRNTRNENQ